jgi:NADPH:quinone reductase-like Zn-dependent oxidoreductase
MLNIVFYLFFGFIYINDFILLLKTYISVDETEIARKPKNLTHLEAASLPFTALTAWNAINIAKIERGISLICFSILLPPLLIFIFLSLSLGMRVLVLGGSGRVGFTLLSLLSRHFHCHVTTTSSPQNMQKILDLGIQSDDVIDHSQVTQLRGGYDAVFDVLGTAQSEATCVAQLRSGGAYVTFNGSLVRHADEKGILVGLANGVRESACKRVHMADNARGVRYGYALFAPNGAALGTLMGMAEKGVLVPDVGKVFSLNQIEKAYEFCMEGGGSGKVVIDVGSKLYT